MRRCSWRNNYETQQLPEASIDDVLDRPYNRPYLAQVDSSASELMRRINSYGITTGKATHRVTEGIKVTRRFICDGHDVRSLMIHPRCVNLIRELQSYRYNACSVKSGRCCAVIFIRTRIDEYSDIFILHREALLL